MTWKEFKEAAESQGVKDDDRINYIDMPGWKSTDGMVDRREDTYGGELVMVVTIS